jgi:hypothetical protein
LNSTSARSKKRIIEMLFAALFTFAAFLMAWLFFSIAAYTLIYGSLIFSYLVIWDAETRRAVCPHGLWAAIIWDE